MIVHHHTLANGLRLVHAEIPGTQMVALNVLYAVGARNEDPSHTGWAHLLEHLMFEGTPRIPDYDTRVQMACGESNAFTNNDFTSFYITVPRTEVETAFHLEADRMVGISLDAHSVEVQKHVVIEEFKQCDLGQPYGDVQHILRPLAYRVHPYRWPTIGITPAHIEGATAEALRDFYNTYYIPSNAILAVAGAISFDEAMALTEKYFSPIAATRGDTHPMGGLPSEPMQIRQRRRTIWRHVPLDMLVMAFHIGNRLSADYYTCDVITDLLSNGQSSRLSLHLVKEQRLMNGINAYINGSIDPDILIIKGRINPGITLQTAEAAVWNELEQLKHELVSDSELEKVRNRMESERVFSGISYLNTAINLAQWTLFDTHPDEEIKRYRAVNSADIQQTAQRIFTKKNSCVLYYKSKAQNSGTR